MKDTIRNFLKKHIKHAVADDDDIFARGFVNSLFVMQLVTFVEQEFDIEVEGDDLSFENFCSINAIFAFVSIKTAT